MFSSTISYVVFGSFAIYLNLSLASCQYNRVSSYIILSKSFMCIWTVNFLFSIDFSLPSPFWITGQQTVQAKKTPKKTTKKTPQWVVEQLPSEFNYLSLLFPGCFWCNHWSPTSNLTWWCRHFKNVAAMTSKDWPSLCSYLVCPNTEQTEGGPCQTTHHLGH